MYVLLSVRTQHDIHFVCCYAVFAHLVVRIGIKTGVLDFCLTHIENEPALVNSGGGGTAMTVNTPIGKISSKTRSLSTLSIARGLILQTRVYDYHVSCIKLPCWCFYRCVVLRELRDGSWRHDDG